MGEYADYALDEMMKRPTLSNPKPSTERQT